MLIVALVLAVIGLAALVTAVVTGNEVVAWVCIGASGLGVLLLIVDAIRERAQRIPVGAATAAESTAVIGAQTEVIESPAETVGATEVIDAVEGETDAGYDADLQADLDAEIETEDHPDEVVHDDPDYDLPTDDEPEFPVPAEEAAIHVVDEGSLDAEYADEGSIDEDYVAEEDVDEDLPDEEDVDEDLRDEIRDEQTSTDVERDDR